MYYKQRKMDAENQVFIRRIGQIPVVKAAYGRAADVYEATKNSNRLFNATLKMAEDSVKYASEMEAVKKILNNTVTTVANKIAVDQLDKIEQKYPSINKTPDELWTDGKALYDQSRVKETVDKIYAAKDYGVNKVTDTKKYYQDLVINTVSNGQEKVANLLRYGLVSLDGVLDYSDGVIDKYVATEPIQQCSSESSYINRVQCMSGKVYTGLKHRAGTKYDATKQYVAQTLGDLQTAMILLEYAKNTAAWANDKTQATLTAAQEQAKSMWSEIQRRTEPFGQRSETVILGLAQGLASNVASLADYIVKYSSPYLSESGGKAVVAASNYAHELRESFLKAKTLGELRDEVIAEGKEKLSYLQEHLVGAIDYFVEFPPVCWLISSRNNKSIDQDAVKEKNIVNGFASDDSSKENGGY